MSIRLISRNDDFGSSRAANQAILEAVKFGWVTRNVSCMAPAPYIAEAARELVKYKHIDVGMHVTLTSEWDGVRWGALSSNAAKYGFAREDGTFFHSAQELRDHRPDVDAILAELDAQLDLLHGLNLKIGYVDSHMFPEYFVPGLDHAMAEWIRKKGLLDAEDYYTVSDPLCPPTRETEELYMDGVEGWLSALNPDGQYFYLAHPAVGTEETLKMYNDRIPVGAMRLERSMEYRAVISPQWLAWIERFDLAPIRYQDAVKGERGVLRRVFANID